MPDPAKPSRDNPFSDLHYDLMCQGGRSCAGTQEILDKLSRAGMDTAQASEQNTQQQRLFDGLKREFFPDRP